MKQPSGRLVPSDTGHDLVLTRTFRAPIDDVWASVTESDRTARWFGPWQGEGRPGATIKVQMAYEESPVWCDMRIDACEPPRRLALSMTDENGTWLIEFLLAEREGTTELRFVQHLTDLDGLGEVGPGWEYYLDMLVAARNGEPAVDFDDYYPAQRDYFTGLAHRPA